MTSLHSRIITLLNNIYVSGGFREEISRILIPSIMTLLIFNVTGHVKLQKQKNDKNRKKSKSDTNYEEDLYNEFFESCCCLLSNITTNSIFFH